MNHRNHVPILDQISEDPVNLNVRILQVGILILALISLVAFSLVFLNLKDKRKEREATVEKRIALLAHSRVEILSTWLSGLIAQGDRVIQSDVFRLYAAEIDLIEDDVSVLLQTPPHAKHPGEGPLDELMEQLPMMENLLREFVSYSGFLAGRIVNRNGQSFIATNASTVALSEFQKTHVQSALSTKRPYYGPLRSHTDGLVLDVFLPIFPPQGATDDPSRPVAVLMLSKVVTSRLSELLSKSPLAQDGEQTRLIQAEGPVFREIAPWVPEGLREVERVDLGPLSAMSFGVRPSLDGKASVYSIGEKVPELDWWVIQEADYFLTNRPLRNYTRTVITIVILGLVTLALFLGAAWWRIMGVENRKIAERFRHLAEHIEGQHQFLESIQSTVTDYIGYKNRNGVYEYVNPAFAKAVGRDVEQFVGLDDRAVFGFDTANRLKTSDEAVMGKKERVTVSEKIYLMSTLHHLLITKIPFRDKEGEVAGIVSVFTDITHLVEARQKGERAIRQTIEALVRTIEMRDPYLAGHSRLMGILSSALADEMKADEQQKATVEFASLLSQIGKVFVDQAILTKSGILSEEERQEVRRHVEHAAAILRGIEFELPVSETIYQMNEYVDGSGYPRGLKGEETLLTAKILAVSNRFCAMIKPRSYRSGLSPQEAMRIVGKETTRYSQEVLAALERFVHSAEGDKLLRKI